MATELEEQRIDVADLRIGMFVCRLDRPWEETSFALQGVELSNPVDIEAVRSQCQHVYIDARRQLTDRPLQTLARTQLSVSRFTRQHHYAAAESFQDEVPRAQLAIEHTSVMVDRIFDQVAGGRELSAEYVEQSVRPLVASVLRNSDVFFWVEGLRAHDNYCYSHALNCSALAAAFGRHMGFAEDTIISLAAGGLLMDIGKTRLPRALVQQVGPLSPDGLALVQSHVQLGLDILSTSSIADSDVMDIMRTHHERHDGSGYPHRLFGNGIPLVGRMLGLIDSYDAMTSVRPYRAAVSRHHALREIYAARDTLFQAEIIEQFQVCLGVYPTGSLVELSTGEVAVVAAQNRVRRLRPQVVVVTAADKQPLDEFKWLDLMDHTPDKPSIDILHCLAPGSYGINAAELFLA